MSGTDGVVFAEPNSTLNPRNITFKSPKKYDSKGNNLGTKDDMEVYYGHYANDWFSKKYPKAKKAPKEWYNKSKNSANPPLAQALFGRGNLVKIGLKDEIDIAVVGLDKDDIKIETLDGNTFRVSYEKPSIEANDSNEEAYDYIHRGIARRGFNMGWKIAAKYNLRNIKASMDKGLLSIEIPIH